MRNTLHSPRLYCLIFSLIIIGVSLLRLLTLPSRIDTSPLSIQEQVAGAHITITADPGVLVIPNDCVMLRWEIENIQTVFLAQHGTVGIGEKAWCYIEEGRNLPTFRIMTVDGTELHYTPAPARAGLTHVGGIALGLLGILYAAVGVFPSRRATLQTLPVIIPLTIVIYTGWMGIDYGEHWDEGVMIREAQDTLYRETLLTDYFFYPSMSYWLTLMANLPYVLSETNPDARPVNLLHARMIFLVVSSLTVLWVYLLSLVWGRGWQEALIAASILAFSWEVAYHLRWIAPDAIMMQFAAFAMLFIVWGAMQHEQHWQLIVAAVGVGLAIASKYQAGMLLLPLFLAVWLRNPAASPLSRLRLIVGLAAIAFLTYLWITPGTLLQPVAFWSDVTEQLTKYTVGEAGRYSVQPGIVHLYRLVEYYALVVMSPFAPLSAVLFLFGIVGGAALIRENWRTSLIYLIFPLIFVAFFAFRSLMIVRNILIVIPFLAVLSARGIGFTLERLPRAGRWGAYGGVAAILIVNAGWLFYTARTIQARHTTLYFEPYVAAARQNPNQTFNTSQTLYDILVEWSNATDTPLPPNIVMNRDADRVAYRLFDVRTALPETYRTKFERVYGSLAVNLNYYDTWREQTVVVISPPKLEPHLLKPLPK